MVGGTTPPQSDSREISRVLVLNLSGKASGAHAPPRRGLSLTTPSLLSRGTLKSGKERDSLGRPPPSLSGLYFGPKGCATRPKVPQRSACCPTPIAEE